MAYVLMPMRTGREMKVIVHTLKTDEVLDIHEFIDK
jgi:hypothetical protein